LRWIEALPAQLNAFLSAITTLAAGGANSFSFIFDTATGDADPGTGKVRFNTAIQSSASVIRLDAQAANGGAIANFLAGLLTGTSNIKGTIRLQKTGDVSSYLIFDITDSVLANGYHNLSVVARGNSSPSPFLKDDTLAVFFDKKGDRGDGGNTPTQAEMRAAIGVLPISSGGTGATTVDAARAALNAKVAGIEPIATGGTGSLNAAGALANLGAMPRAGGAFTGQVLFPAGSQSQPSIAFSEPGNDTGFFWMGDGRIGIVCDNVLVGQFNSGGLEVIKITQTKQ
jgi:hypothetical protein